MLFFLTSLWSSFSMQASFILQQFLALLGGDSIRHVTIRWPQLPSWSNVCLFYFIFTPSRWPIVVLGKYGVEDILWFHSVSLWSWRCWCCPLSRFSAGEQHDGPWDVQQAKPMPSASLMNTSNIHFIQHWFSLILKNYFKKLIQHCDFPLVLKLFFNSTLWFPPPPLRLIFNSTWFSLRRDFPSYWTFQHCRNRALHACWRGVVTGRVVLREQHWLYSVPYRIVAYAQCIKVMDMQRLERNDRTHEVCKKLWRHYM